MAEGHDCNPIASEWDCLLPYPSNFFLAPDDSMPSGSRVEIPRPALPLVVDEAHLDTRIDFLQDQPADGFSVGAQIGVQIPGGVDVTGLPFYTTDEGIELSRTTASPTLILDAGTGEAVPHFAEVNGRPDDAADRALLIRPLVRLENGRRYVVALQKLKSLDGSDVVAPKGFASLRDGNPSGERMERLARYFDAHVFPVTVSFGLQRSSLVLAWDFTVGTEEHATGDMLSVRRQIIDTLETTPPAVRVVSVEDYETGPIARGIEGMITVPLFTEVNEPGTLLHRGADGRPAQNGVAEFPFRVRIPRVLLENPGEQGRVVQYGHGFFGGIGNEVDSDAVSRFARESRSIVVATGWTGMMKEDATGVFGSIMQDTSKAMRFVERVHQGMANFIALGFAVKGPLLSWESLQHDDGTPLFDPEHLYFYGNSQGHILGGTFLALSPHVKRGAMGVGGANFGLMMSRSKPFAYHLAAIDLKVGGPVASQKVALLMQSALDRIDPITYAPHVLRDPYPGSPVDRRVVLQIGIGDPEVPNIAAHVHARALGVSHLVPSPRPIWGLAQVPAPFDGSAIAEWDFGVEIPDLVARPTADAPDNGVHEGVRRTTSSIKQIDAFFRPDGLIENFCAGGDGPCVAPGF